MTEIIFLDGAASTGKTTLAKALFDGFDGAWLHSA